MIIIKKKKRDVVIFNFIFLLYFYYKSKHTLLNKEKNMSGSLIIDNLYNLNI